MPPCMAFHVLALLSSLYVAMAAPGGRAAAPYHRILLHHIAPHRTAPHRTSLCIEKKQAYCHYQLKPPPKPRASKAARPRLHLHHHHSSPFADVAATGAAKRMAGGMLVAPSHDNGNFAMMQGSMALKRYRLSASPATGFVGMRENGFLADFFGCFGLLPLATER